MTEPNDGQAIEPEPPADPPSRDLPSDPAPEPEGEVPPAAPTGQPGWVPPETAPTPSWIQPSQGGGSRRTLTCLVLVIVGIIVLVIGCSGLVFLGSQVQSILAGTIEFGTGGTGCSVTGRATTFPSTTALRSVAHLQREAHASETVTVVVTYPDATTESANQTMTDSADCVSQSISAGLAPGHYTLQYRVGTEILATGGFDITTP